AAQYVAGDLTAVAGVTDAQAQAVEAVLIAELGNDVAQPVVPAVSAALFELGDAGRHVEFVVGHQDGFRLDAEESRQRGDGLSAAVHEGGGDQQTNIAALMGEFTRQVKILFVEGQAHAFAVGQTLNEKSPCVMPGLVVFGAWITQADDQLYGSHIRGPSSSSSCE